MIRQSRRLGGSALYPLPTRRVVSLPLPPHTLVRPAEVVATAHQEHPRLKRLPQPHRSTRATYQCTKPRAEGGRQPLYVSGVDHCSFRALHRSKPLHNGLVGSSHYPPNHIEDPALGVSLDGLGDHYSLRQDEPRTTYPSGAKRLPEQMD